MSYCIACGAYPAEIHHVKTKGSHPALREAKFNLMPLCHPCHQKAHQMGLNSFYSSSKAVSNWLIKNGWERDILTKKWLPPQIN